jgi:hypothetical protein
MTIHAGPRPRSRRCVGCRHLPTLEVARRFDVSEDGTLVLRLDYLEVVARKPAWL